MIEILLEAYEAEVLVLWGAGLLGLAFGVVAERSGYCTRSAVAEWFAPGTGRNGSAMVLAAIAVAAFGGAAFWASGLADPAGAIAWSVPLRPVALVAGGLLFGVGMVLARGCASRLLVLAGSGNGRAVVTLLIMGLAAYATMRGLLYPLRNALEGLWAIEGGAVAATDPANASWFAAFFGALALAGLALTLRLAGPRAVLYGAAIGGLVLVGWWVTGVVGAEAFEPVALTSLSYVAPVAESVQYAMVATGDTLRFGILLVVGTLVGAFVSSLIGGRFARQGFDADAPPLWRYVAGGLLMGFGGVTALGCTVGQGLSGLSAGAPGSALAFAAIVAGAALTLAWLREPLRPRLPELRPI